MPIVPQRNSLPAVGDALNAYVAQGEKNVRLATAAPLAFGAAVYTSVNGPTGRVMLLTAASNGALLVDGLAVAVGDRILVTQEATATNNGLYVVLATGSAGSKYILQRLPEASQSSDFYGGFTVGTGPEGFHNQNSFFVFVTPNSGATPFVLDTNNVVFLPTGMNSLTEPSVYKARAVVTANVASLAAFAGVTGGSATNSDGILAVQGDIVLLASQTTPAQNGPYVVGVVAAGTAPLTRPGWWSTASVQPTGALITVGGEGTLYKNTLWKAMAASTTIIVDTNDPKFYPMRVSFTAALVAGTLTAGAGATAGAPANIPIFSTNTKCSITRRTPNTSTLTVMYAMNGAPTAGVPGTGAIVVFATVAAGTINNADISTLDVVVDNQL